MDKELSLFSEHILIANVNVVLTVYSRICSSFFCSFFVLFFLSLSFLIPVFLLFLLSVLLSAFCFVFVVFCF